MSAKGFSCHNHASFKMTEMSLLQPSLMLKRERDALGLEITSIIHTPNIYIVNMSNTEEKKPTLLI